MRDSVGAVIIGDEILSGTFVDQNTPFLAKRLHQIGVRLSRVAVIPDALADIAATVAEFSRRFTHVVTSGGVGPTHDDLTIDGVAAAFDETVIVHPQLEQLVRDHWGDNTTSGHLRLARVPASATLVPTDGMWPTPRAHNVIMLPGVPELFARKVEGLSSLWAGRPFFRQRLYLNASESAIATELTAFTAEHPTVQIGSYPRLFSKDHSLIITLQSDDEAALNNATLALRALLADYLTEPPA